MKYPINARKYIAAMRQEFGPNETAEGACRAIIPVANDAYFAGLHGKSGYRKDKITFLHHSANVLKML